MSFMDFNDATPVDLIPKGELVKVILAIRNGGYNDPQNHWTGGYATRAQSGSVYLNAEYTVIEGPYQGRKIFELIGLYSPKGENWGRMGRNRMRQILNSAYGFSNSDMSEAAQKARQIKGFGDFNGLELVIRIKHETNMDGELEAKVASVDTKDIHRYGSLMGGGGGAPRQFVGSSDISGHQLGYREQGHQSQTPQPSGNEARAKATGQPSGTTTEDEWPPRHGAPSGNDARAKATGQPSGTTTEDERPPRHGAPDWAR